MDSILEYRNIGKNKWLAFHHSIIPSFLLLLVVVIGNSALSQETDTTSASIDTAYSSAKHGPVIYHTGDNDLVEFSIDTTLAKLHFYDPTEQAGFRYRTIGTLGGPHFPLVFQPNTSFGFNLGFDQFDLYRFTPGNVRFYHTPGGPYSHLMFIIGRNKEQTTKVEHSQNLGKHFQFGFQYRRFATDGDYANQRSRHNAMAFTTNYQSKSKRYELSSILIVNNMKQEENGGVKAVDIFRDTSFLRKELVGVETERAQNKRNDVYFTLRQAWNLGSKEKKKEDSSEIEIVAPSFKLYHEVGIGREKYDYLDESPDSSYYGIFFPVSDTFIHDFSSRVKDLKLNTKFGLRKIFSGFKNENRQIIADVSTDYAYHIIEQNSDKEDLVHYLDLKASVYSDPVGTGDIGFAASGGYSFLDHNKKDFELSGSLKYMFKRRGAVKAGASYQRLQPAWIFRKYRFADISWNNKIQKTDVFSADLTFEFPQYHFHVSGQFYNVKNWAYWDERKLPNQDRSNTQVYLIELRKLFTFYKFGLDNLFRVQLISDKDFIRHPVYWSLHTFYFESWLFKGALLTRIGIDIWYNTDYFANGYFPLTGQFYIQNQDELVFYPVLDFHISLQVKTFRFFFKMKNLNQGMFKRNGYFNAYKYPAQDRSFRFGISWRFYD